LGNKNGVKSDERMLWHGFRNISSKAITHGEEGFDMRFSRDGMKGIGNYFAINASYSARDTYVHKKKNGQKSLILAKVLVGISTN